MKVKERSKPRCGVGGCELVMPLDNEAWIDRVCFREVNEVIGREFAPEEVCTSCLRVGEGGLAGHD